MRTMDKSRWLRASGHLDYVLELAPGDRDAWIASLREQDPESAADVAGMLDEHRRLAAEGFLESAAPLQPHEAPLAGITLGAYTLVSRIGHGGLGPRGPAPRGGARLQ